MDFFIRKNVGAFFRMFLRLWVSVFHGISIGLFYLQKVVWLVDFYPHLFLVDIRIVQIPPVDVGRNLEVF